MFSQKLSTVYIIDYQVNSNVITYGGEKWGVFTLVLPYLSVSSVWCSVGIFLVFSLSSPYLFLVFPLSVVSD